MKELRRDSAVALYPVFIVLSILIWVYLFRFFFDAQMFLQGDAFPYLGHVRSYVDNIVRGVYPLWTPLGENGNVNEFFLRRIGEFNPIFLLIAVFNKLGFSFEVAHRLFLGAYFLLAVAGFYLLAWRLFIDRSAALTAALLLLFSSWSGKFCESYILLELTPLIWFAYFLTAFLQTPQRFFLLGAVFTLMVINITYIPFYFYTILFLFLICLGGVYWPQVPGMIKPSVKFLWANKLFVGICSVLLCMSLIPGSLWLGQSRNGEAFSQIRRQGADGDNTATVGINKVNEGGILPYSIVDKQFFYPDLLKLEDPYVPVFAYLMLFVGLCLKINRRFLVIFLFSGILFVIGLVDATPVHNLIYNWIPFFKYFRNLEFFLWWAIIPAFILFVAEQIRVFKQARFDRRWMTGWVIAAHFGMLVFCVFQETQVVLTYVTIAASLSWMLVLIWKKENERLALLFLWVAIIAQPTQVLGQWASRYPPFVGESGRPTFEQSYVLPLPSPEEAQRILNFGPSLEENQSSPFPYFGVRWYYEAIENIPQPVILSFIKAPFLVYNSVQFMDESHMNYLRVAQAMAGFEDLAFIHSDRAGEKTSGKNSQVRIITKEDTDFKVLKYDANHLRLQTTFTEER
ncbi:MAG: hypothetical protein JNN05_05050, partial [Candidatus Omnitrophica bacterium]|nr:hypothetical protein [Candidatus Omnitrophota bacterium]